MNSNNEAFLDNWGMDDSVTSNDYRSTNDQNPPPQQQAYQPPPQNPPQQQAYQPPSQQQYNNTSGGEYNTPKKSYNKGGYDQKENNTYKRGAKSNYPPPTVEHPYGIHLDASCPQDVVDTLTKVARMMDASNFLLRWKNPEKGCPHHNVIHDGVNKKEIVLPWKDFDNMTADYLVNSRTKVLSSQLLPGFDSQQDAVKALMACNVQMVLGQYLKSPVRIMMIWTPDGCVNNHDVTKETGYLSGLIKICNIYNIPIINFQRSGGEELAVRFKDSFDRPIKTQ